MSERVKRKTALFLHSEGKLDHWSVNYTGVNYVGTLTCIKWLHEESQGDMSCFHISNFVLLLSITSVGIFQWKYKPKMSRL